MATPESIIKKGIKEYVKAIGGIYIPVTGGPYGLPGSPDGIVCYKGLFIAVEGKTLTGRQSEVQKLRQRQIEAAGGIYILARSVDDVKKVLETL